MIIINISIPSELLDKINKYKKLINKNRSEFFFDAAKHYLRKIDKYITFENRKKAVKNLMKINEKIKKEGLFKDVDFVKEIRNLRQARMMNYSEEQNSSEFSGIDEFIVQEKTEKSLSLILLLYLSGFILRMKAELKRPEFFMKNLH